MSELKSQTASFKYSIARMNNTNGKFERVWDHLFLYVKGSRLWENQRLDTIMAGTVWCINMSAFAKCFWCCN